jgi:glycosyltransferase involved in cell wall biosynthesis
MNPLPPISIVIPAKNEASSVAALVGGLRQCLPTAQIILVDDGSTDDTGAVARGAGAHVVRHPYSIGNGAAIKSGVRIAQGEIVVCMDADGQHDPAEIPKLLAKIEKGYDMVVGARSADAHSSTFRRWANAFYNRLASWMSGHPIADLTSGFRAARTSKFREFLSLLPNGFSYPTTITMAFLRCGYPVAFEPVDVRRRQKGTTSHIRPMRDGARFVLIIFKLATLYSPLKLFIPFSATFFAAGCWYYAYTYAVSQRFTNMGLLLFLSSALLFLLGLVSEQITALMYMRSSER